MLLSVVPSSRVRPGKVVYVADDLSFDTFDREEAGVTSILINDIHVDFTERFEANAVWGLSPSTAWRQGFVEKPQGFPGTLQLLVRQSPGISTQITPSNRPWPVTLDSSSGWLYVGIDKTESDTKLEFLSGCVVGLVSSAVCGLWLHPEFI